MNSRDYWKKREDEARKNTIRDEKEYNARLNEIYEYTIANIERQVNDWYARYASKEGITMAEARGRVKHIDMERYERLAAKYVATHDFSEQANQEMALYNLTMKVNRLELLKAQINLELMAGFDDIQHEMERDLIQTAMKEDRRLAGILGDSVIGNEEYAKQLVNASFRNATFSERIWGRNMPDLRIHLEAELRNGLVQGIGSVELARRFRKHYGGSVKDTERLMTTEMCRLQTAVQKESFERNGYKEYMFITSGNDNVCPDCQALHGQHFKVSEMQAGVNAPPMHPRCHCSVAAYMDSDKYKRWIDALANGEDVRWNEFESGDNYTAFKNGESATEFFGQRPERSLRRTDRELYNQMREAYENSMFGSWNNNLSMDEVASIGAYSGDAYSGINGLLRHCMTEKMVDSWNSTEARSLQDMIQNIDSAISQFDLKSPIKVYRTCEKDVLRNLKLEPGSTFHDDGFVSTSVISEKVASGNIVMEINVPAGKGHGAWINPLSGAQDEEWEFLLQRGSDFQVQSVDSRGDDTVVRLDLLGHTTTDYSYATKEEVIALWRENGISEDDIKYQSDKI